MGRKKIENRQNQIGVLVHLDKAVVRILDKRASLAKLPRKVVAEQIIVLNTLTIGENK